MIKTRHAILGGLAVAGIVAGATACSSKADVVSHNISKQADNFQVDRRIVFFNGITDKYLLEITGPCSIDTSDAAKLAVTCKTGPGTYKKHYLGLSDNVSYFVEQGQPVKASSSHYKVIFKPSVIVPDINFQ